MQREIFLRNRIVIPPTPACRGTGANDHVCALCNRVVIPTGAYPDFLLCGTNQTATCAAFSKESRMKCANATNLDRKSGVAQWRDLRFLHWQ
jgi:hypothetical protein